MDTPPSESPTRFYRIGFWVNFVLVIAFAVATVLLGSLVAVLVNQQNEMIRRIPESFPLTRNEESAIRGVLDAQVAAWNNGDLDGFMAGYWRDEKLTFMSGDRVTQGWEATRARYQKKYFAADKDGKLAERGELAFEELQVEEIHSAAALVRGRFVQKFAADTATGRFTLVFRKFPEGWRITSDHTSAADPPPPPKK